MAASICSEPKILEAMKYVNIFVSIIRIVVPIILIFSASFKFISVIKTGDEDNLNKVKKSVITNAIAAVIIFLIPGLISLIVKISFSENDYKNCLEANDAIIVQAYENKIEKLVALAEETLNIYDYNNAYLYLKNIKDEEKRNEYEDRLLAVKEQIDLLSASNSIDCDYGDTECEKESTITGSNPKAKIFAKCTGEYENGYGVAKLKVELKKGNATNYKFLIDKKEVQNGNSSSFVADDEYTLLIYPKVVIKSNNGEETTVACFVNRSNHLPYNKKGYYFSVGSSKDIENIVSNPFPQNDISYYIHVPKNIEENERIPLIVALHGGYGWGPRCGVYNEGNQVTHYLKMAFFNETGNINGGDGDDIRALILAPSNMTCDWDGSMPEALDIVHAIIKTYNIDFKHIVLTGSSQGGVGSLYMGFLEEQILYKASDNNTTLESVARKYGTTAEAVKKYNSRIRQRITYSDASRTKLQKGYTTIIRSKNDNEQRSIYALIAPFSPAKNTYRCAFMPSTVYDSDRDERCETTPPHTLKTPIWVVTSNDEYGRVVETAEDLTAYYSKNGDIRYSVLTGLQDPHYTEGAIFSRTNAAEWFTTVTYGNISVKDNSDIISIEKQLGSNFLKKWP